MLSDKARKTVEEMCYSLDMSGLEELDRIVRRAYEVRVQRELERWRPGQDVRVNLGDKGRSRGKIVTVNKSSVTVDLGGRRVRVGPRDLVSA